MCHSAHAFDPALAVPEALDDVFSFLEIPPGHPPTGNLMEECSQLYASRPETNIVLPQQYQTAGLQLSYCSYGEPWFPDWTQDDACSQELHTNYLSTPVNAVDSLSFFSESPACPTLAFEDSPLCLSSLASPNGSPSWPWESWAGYSCSMLIPGKCLSRSRIPVLRLSSSHMPHTRLRDSESNIFFLMLTNMSGVAPEPGQSSSPVTENPSPSNKNHKKKRAKGTVFCTVCSTRFDKTCHLQAHMREHKGQYKCETCEQTFAEANHLAIHRESHDTTPQTCPDCGKVFKIKSSYTSHRKLHDKHRQRVKCPHAGCDKSYNQQAVLNRHMKIVSVVCTSHFSQRYATGWKTDSAFLELQHDPDRKLPECSDCKTSFTRLDLRDR